MNIYIAATFLVHETSDPPMYQHHKVIYTTQAFGVSIVIMIRSETVTTAKMQFSLTKEQKHQLFFPSPNTTRWEWNRLPYLEDASIFRLTYMNVAVMVLPIILYLNIGYVSHMCTYSSLNAGVKICDAVAGVENPWCIYYTLADACCNSTVEKGKQALIILTAQGPLSS